ncbi:MAG: hypothetical protein ABIS50_25825 [Luteolibacter sp.]|uniref:hypothetical protein n=1 Tax=Luteolibacter sp. TaxID=1962973 RepID=UPI003264A455
MNKRWYGLGKSLGILAILLGGSVAGIYFWHRHVYPYGQSHCCILGVQFALTDYAEAHGGRFPHGESSPEASLSLLYKEEGLDANTLRGMTVPEKTTRAILESGHLLTPATCGWHYVEGLTKSDDPRLALLWCKEPLQHDGSRGKSGAREVVRVDGDRSSVSGDQWTEFLKEQQQLMEKRSASEIAGKPVVRAAVELPDHTQIETIEGYYVMDHSSHSKDSSGSGRGSGSSLKVSDLTWYRAPVQHGSETRTLMFSNMTSDPVTVTFTNGVPDVREVVFRMKEIRK